MGKPIINPVYYNEAVKKTWKEHQCDSESGICDCAFMLICPSCESEQRLLGEGLDEHFGRDCKCDMCFYGIDDGPVGYGSLDDLPTPFDIDTVLPCGSCGMCSDCYGVSQPI